MAFAVEGGIVRDGDLAVSLGGDAGLDPAFGQCVAEAAAVIFWLGQ